MIKDLGLVFCGGGLGAAIRFLLARAIEPTYFAIFGINVLGSLLIGVIAGILDRGGAASWIRPFIIAGVLGGFTTFSSFALDGLKMLRDGKMGLALAYTGGSVMLGLLACWLGYSLTFTPKQ